MNITPGPLHRTAVNVSAHGNEPAMPTPAYLEEKNKSIATPRIETSFKLFKSHIPSIKYLFKNGKEAIFREGKFSTNIQNEIEELTEEVAQNHPHIYIDDSDSSAEYSTEDPLAALKERLRKEIQAEQLKDKLADAGTSQQPALKPASSADISKLAAGSSSTSA